MPSVYKKSLAEDLNLLPIAMYSVVILARLRSLLRFHNIHRCLVGYLQLRAYTPSKLDDSSKLDENLTRGASAEVVFDCRRSF